MALDLQLVPPTPAHLDELVAEMRPADVAECLASHGSPRDAVNLSVAVATHAWAVLEQGRLLCIWGVREWRETLLGEPVGLVWMLGTRALRPRALVEASRVIVRNLLRDYVELQALVDARYRGTFRWLRWLGWQVLPAVPVGAERLPFHPVRVRRA